MTDYIISVSNLSFSYDKKKTFISNLSLDIDRGSINAIFGPNGCGKTTLIKCLLKFFKSEGSIVINGKEISKISFKEIASLVSYVPQFIDIPMNFSVRDYIVLGLAPNIKFYQSPSDELYKKVDEIAKKLNIEKIVNKTINSLSGGEMQMVSIARALAQHTDIIVLDEPMASLDFGNQGRLLRLLRKLNQEGKTIIFTTHNPNHISFLKCNVFFMKNGSLLESTNNLSKEMIKNLYDEEVTIFCNDELETYFWKQ